MPGSRRLTHAEAVDQLADLPAWRLVHRSLRATFVVPDVPTVARLVAGAFEEAEEMGHHPYVDIRYIRLAFHLSTHDASGVTQLDIELAHRLDAVAARLGATVDPRPPVTTEIAIDTSDKGAISGFWQAALAYRSEVDDPDALVDPAGLGPALWFQVTDSPAEGRNRFHLDVSVGDLDEAARRRSAVEAAGGRLLSDEAAPAFWVYADPDGNEACICTGFGREGPS